MKYISGPYAQGQLLRDIHEIEIALTERFLRSGVITDAAEQRSWRERVQDVSFARNTVMYDDQGNPSVMVVITLMTKDNLLSGEANMPHPAFIVNGIIKSQLYIGKYPCITTGSGATLRALSLKHLDPVTDINFDNALLACKQKGVGWHLLTNAEWAAIALWCKNQGFWPRGNNNYGKDVSVASEKGRPSYFYSNSIARTLTGSGPLPWSHDGSPFGIFDLNGNVWKWVGGMRVNAGEIQILENNNAADNTKSQATDSTEWKAILQDGSLVTPGTADTLKYDFVNVPANEGAARINISTQANPSEYYSYNTFETLAVAAGVTIPNLLKLLGLAPVDASHGADGMWTRNTGERLPFRGGRWDSTSAAGVCALRLLDLRSYSVYSIGFPLAFVI